MFGRLQHIHFVGIGGIGMSGIAKLALALGSRVSGSDANPVGTTEHLRAAGAMIFTGHRAEHIAGAEVVVVSSAVKADNPEVIAAREAGVPVIPRAEMLAELMRTKFGIAVAGSHGKTTTSAMIALVLTEAGFDPTVVIGGKLSAIGGNARVGQSEYMVIEADESDGTFLKFSPVISVVTNIDREHLDFYKDLDEIKRYFAEFINRVPFYGMAVACVDDANLASLVPAIARRVTTYGFSPDADLTAHDVALTRDFRSRFTVRRQGRDLGTVVLRVPGEHNVRNALAAVAVGLELKVPFERIATALGNFTGADRRFQVKGDVNDVLVVDDYGHHPVEVAAVLRAARTSGRRTVVLFQPHRYSRTRHLFDEFAGAFGDADVVCVADIYGAGESPIEGISSPILAEAIARTGHADVTYVGGLDDAVAAIARVVKPGDVVITLGAGNVWKAGEELVRLMGKAGNSQ